MLQAQIEPHFLFNTLANVFEPNRNRAVAGSQDARSVHVFFYARRLTRRVSRRHNSARNSKVVEAYLSVLKVRMASVSIIELPRRKNC